MSNHGTQDKPAINTHTRGGATAMAVVPSAQQYHLLSNKHLKQHLPVSCVGGPQRKPHRWRVVRRNPATMDFEIQRVFPLQDTWFYFSLSALASNCQSGINRSYESNQLRLIIKLTETKTKGIISIISVSFS